MHSSQSPVLITWDGALILPFSHSFYSYMKSIFNQKRNSKFTWYVRQGEISLHSFQVLSIFWIGSCDKIKIFPRVSSFCVGRISTSLVFWHKCQYHAYLMFSPHQINLAKWQGQTISLITTKSLQPLCMKNIPQLNLSSRQNMFYLFFKIIITLILSALFTTTLMIMFSSN